MAKIFILSDSVSNKIAAGEVVERPASVVKELLENALDAGASRVEIEVDAGGRRRIRVLDDGEGMGRDDALLAFERHATSKIRQAEDLMAIATLGFRGEALPSLAAVSRLKMQTRQGEDATGTQIQIHGGKLRDVRECAWAAGTEMDIRDLFYNIPVRKKFLKSETTELGHIASLVTHYAIAHPEKSFSLKTGSRTLVDVAGVGDRRERVFQLLGGQVLEQLVEIPRVERRLAADPVREDVSRDTAEKNDAEPGVIRLSGFISRPEVQRLNRKQIFIFINGRLVRDRLLLHAIREAYRNILPSGMFPIALVFLEMAPEEVDVNVHPTKMEVRFRRGGFVHDFTRDTIRQVLIAARPIPRFPTQGKPAMGVAVDASGPPRALAQTRTETGGRSRVSGGARDSVQRASAKGEFQLSSPAVPSSAQLPWQAEAALSVYAPSVDTPAVDTPMKEAGSGTFPEAGDEVAAETFVPPQVPSEREKTPFGEQEEMNPLGQVQDSFIVAENGKGLWIVDQHVAHERILFEQHLRRRLRHQVESQRLLLPIVVELTPGQGAAFEDWAKELEADGFEIEPFGKNTVAVKAVPAEVPTDRVEKLLQEILEEAEKNAREMTLETLRRQIAASVACHSAIKVNMPLGREKMVWLLRELMKTEVPMSCPHGRPIILRYSLKELRKAFKRT